MENIDIRLRCLELAIELEKVNNMAISRYEVTKTAEYFYQFILESKNKD